MNESALLYGDDTCIFMGIRTALCAILLVVPIGNYQEVKPLRNEKMLAKKGRSQRKEPQRGEGNETKGQKLLSP